MADARAMLRAERANRRLTHPHASYTSDGKLSCNLCDILVKSEAHWQSHLHSTQHILRSQRQQDAAATRNTSSGGRKRKASTLSSPVEEERKKARPTGVDEDAVLPQSGAPGVGPNPVDQGLETASSAEPIQHGTKTATPEARDDVNEAELLAFERELAELEATDAAPARTAMNAAATISAAPMTAEEVAAQAREEQSAQRGKRDAEIEEEREEAARLLEDEFDEMEGLEERVKKLREKREALRTVNGEIKDTSDGSIQNVGTASEIHAENGAADEDEDDEEDFDDWEWGSELRWPS